MPAKGQKQHTGLGRGAGERKNGLGTFKKKMNFNVLKVWGKVKRNGNKILTWNGQEGVRQGGKREGGNKIGKGGKGGPSTHVKNRLS